MEDLTLVDNMATSSIMHNFIIRDPDAAKRLAKALEESANDPPRPISREFKCLKDPDELREFLQKVKLANAAETDGEEE